MKHLNRDSRTPTITVNGAKVTTLIKLKSKQHGGGSPPTNCTHFYIK